jgi:hypothetical protein
MKKEKNKYKERLDNLLAKFRKAIHPYIKKFKQAEFKKNNCVYRSAITGYRIKSVAEVDHKYPHTFKNLAYDYLKENKVDINNIQDIQELLNGFIEYHNQNAVLRIVSKSQNKYEWLKYKSRDRKWEDFYNFTDKEDAN